jgi:quercetin dioxygenase-like cupin family protein
MNKAQKEKVPSPRKTSNIPSGRHQPLTGPLLHFDLSAEMEHLRQEELWQHMGHNARTLVKHPDFRIVLTVLKAGTRLQGHQAAGSISVQALSGHLRLHLPELTVELLAGHLLALGRALPHDVEAVEDSAFLLSIAWPKGIKDES